MAARQYNLLTNKSPQMIVLNSRRELAERHIAQLTTRRESIAEKIQAVHAAAAEIGGQASPSRTAELCGKVGRTAITLAAVKFWLQETGNSYHHLTDNALLTGVVQPPEVLELIRKMISVNGKSEEPERYYQDGSFKPLAVTTAEKEDIFRRSEIYGNNAESVELYRMIDQRCRLANLANSPRVSDGTRVLLKDIAGSVFRQFIGQRETANGSTFFVHLQHFGKDADFRPAFDEGTVSMI
jgi:hypothetical protein